MRVPDVFPEITESFVTALALVTFEISFGLMNILMDFKCLASTELFVANAARKVKIAMHLLVTFQVDNGFCSKFADSALEGLVGWRFEWFFGMNSHVNNN